MNGKIRLCLLIWTSDMTGWLTTSNLYVLLVVTSRLLRMLPVVVYEWLRIGGKLVAMLRVSWSSITRGSTARWTWNPVAARIVIYPKHPRKYSLWHFSSTSRRMPPNCKLVYTEHTVSGSLHYNLSSHWKHRSPCFHYWYSKAVDALPIRTLCKSAGESYVWASRHKYYYYTM